MIATLAQQTASSADESYLVWGFILFAVASGLLVLEFLIPSGGLIAMLCGIAAVGSIIAFFLYDTTWGTVAIIAYLVLVPIVVTFFFKVFIHSPLAQRLVLGARQDPPGLTPEEAVAVSEQERQKKVEELKQLIGAEGVTVTALRPVGTVKIGGRRIDGMAESSIIEAGTPIIVTDVYDNQIKVRPVQNTQIVEFLHLHLDIPPRGIQGILLPPRPHGSAALANEFFVIVQLPQKSAVGKSAVLNCSLGSSAHVTR